MLLAPPTSVEIEASKKKPIAGVNQLGSKGVGRLPPFVAKGGPIPAGAQRSPMRNGDIIALVTQVREGAARPHAPWTKEIVGSPPRGG